MSYFSRNNLLLWIIIVLLIIILSALGAVIHNTRTYHRLSRETNDSVYGDAHRIKEMLNLNEQQVFKIKQIRVKRHSLQLRLRKEMFNKRQDFINELTSDNPDTNKLNAMISDMVQMQLELRKESIKQYFEIKAICNPEQQKKLEMFEKERLSGDRRAKMRGNRR
jgi:Spy/CpxP family protein refolding chaperone